MGARLAAALAAVLAAPLLAARPVSADAPPPVALMTWPDLLGRPRPKPAQTVRWGPGRAQAADLWLPAGPGPHPVVIMVHGGCWQTRIATASIMDWAAEDLRRRGFAVWNLEYRGIDEAGGGYPGTFADAAASADALRDHAGLYGLDLRRVIALGHSAGGHLAMWLAARPRLPRSSPLWSAAPLAIFAVVSVGGLPDLEADRATKNAACGAAAVDRLVGPPRPDHPDVFADTSPARLLPIGAQQESVAGEADSVAPPWLAKDWTDKAQAAGDTAGLTIAPGGHVELIAPGSIAWEKEVSIIVRLTARPGR